VGCAADAGAAVVVGGAAVVVGAGVVVGVAATSVDGVLGVVCAAVAVIAVTLPWVTNTTSTVARTGAVVISSRVRPRRSSMTSSRRTASTLFFLTQPGTTGEGGSRQSPGPTPVTAR